MSVSELQEIFEGKIKPFSYKNKIKLIGFGAKSYAKTKAL
jgi:hypothetical protein